MKLFLLTSLLFFAAGSLNSKSEKSIIYSPIGKRDPFKPPAQSVYNRDLAAVNPLERFSVEQLQLKAILRGAGKNRAMFEDPEGKSHILLEGDSLGRERATISRVLNTGVIVSRKTFNYLGVESLIEEVVSLPTDDVDTKNATKK